MFACFLVLAGCLVPGQPPAPQHYRIDLRLRWSIDRPAVDTNQQRGTATEVAWISVTHPDDDRRALVVIDSLTTSGTGLMEMTFDTSVGRKARGVSYDVHLVDGKIQEPVTPSTQSPATASLAQAIRMLFPLVRTKAAIGDRWPDSSLVSSTGHGGTLSGVTVTQWRVTAIRHDTLVLVGATTGHSVVTGGMPSTSTRTGTETLIVAPGGSVWAATNEMEQDMINTRSDTTERIGAKGTASVTIQRIR
ncbi:MAG TPA: hypothetical protein VHW65_12060 [Gemmatimonadales bacterium]|jgi:hypothetical protein|nr:hypothetical protein [Gemmatimonadales bacterium]